MNRKKFFPVIILVIIVFIILSNNNAKQLRNDDTKLITDTFQKYIVRIPSNWSVFIANPEKVQKALDENKNDLNATPESLYGYNEPEYTNENSIRSVNTVFQSGTSTKYLYGAYKTSFVNIMLNSDIKIESPDSLEAYVKENIRYQESLNNGNKLKIIKNDINNSRSYFIIEMKYVFNPDILYEAYIKFKGKEVFYITGHNLTSGNFVKIVSSFNSI